MPPKSYATLLTFVLMMIINPSAAKRAQEEIDNITKKLRLPTLDDRPEIPYVDCIVKEMLR